MANNDIYIVRAKNGVHFPCYLPRITVFVFKKCFNLPTPCKQNLSFVQGAHFKE